METLEYVGVRWGMLEYTGVCWSMLEYVGVCWSMSEYTGVCWSFLETVRAISDHVSFQALTKHLPAQYNSNVDFLRVDRKYQADLLHEYLTDEAHLHDLLRQHVGPRRKMSDD